MAVNGNCNLGSWNAGDNGKLFMIWYVIRVGMIKVSSTYLI